MGTIIIHPDGEVEVHEEKKPEENRPSESELRERFDYVAPGLQPVVTEEKPKTPPPPMPLDIENIGRIETPKGPTLH